MEHIDHPDIEHAVRLHRWWKNGELGARVGPYLTAVEVDAVDAIEDGRLAREADDAERMKARMENDRRTRSAAGRAHSAGRR